MTDRQKSFSSPAASCETLEIIEHRHTARSKIAIGTWTALAFASAVLSYLCFDLHNRGIDWVLEMRVVPTTRLVAYSLNSASSLLVKAGYLGFICATWCGIRALIALVIPPAVRIHQMRTKQFEDILGL